MKGKQKNELVLCIRTGSNGMLDVARSTFCKIIDEIHRTFEYYKDHDEMSVPGMTLGHNKQR